MLAGGTALTAAPAKVRPRPAFTRCLSLTFDSNPCIPEGQLSTVKHRSSRQSARVAMLLQSGRQMLDAAFECTVVALANDHAHMPLIVVDERLPQGRKVSAQ